MAASAPVVSRRLEDLNVLSLADLATQCEQRMSAGERLVTFFGRAEGDSVAITAVLQSQAHGLQVLRARARRGASYPALSARFPAAQVLERELWEQTGTIPQGHPWLKPVRFQGSRQGHTSDYPFFKMRGPEVHEVGVGPIHASVIEPGHFRFMCHGERIEHLEIQLGYQHRNVEALLLQRPAFALGSLVETVVGDSSVAYSSGYCAALESLCGNAVSAGVKVTRGIALELERIAMHLSSLSGMITDVAFLQGGATYGRLRTAVINSIMRICGSRFGRGWLRPGGLRFAIDEEQRSDLQAVIRDLARDIDEVNELVLGSRSVQSRLKGTGALSKQTAMDLGLVGMAARACGIEADARSDLPGRLYSQRPLPPCGDSTGDCWARMRVRMAEIQASARWILSALADTELAGEHPATRSAPLTGNAFCVSVQEGFRGPIVQCLETDAAGQLVHYKITDPSMINWYGVALAVRGNEISDFPICNKSFDLSYCGSDL